MDKLVALIKSLLAEAPGALAGHLNVAEIQRIVLTTLLSSGGVAAILPALLASIGTIVAPQDVALATAAVTIVAEVRRRLGQGVVAAA